MITVSIYLIIDIIVTVKVKNALLSNYLLQCLMALAAAIASIMKVAVR